MNNCPNCGSAINSEGKSGLFRTKNKFISEENLRIINEALKHSMHFEKICEKCIDATEFITGGVYARVSSEVKRLTEDTTSNLNNQREELQNELRKESTNVVKCFSITPENFTPHSLIESVIMFDSGARSTSADNLNAGIWNVVNDSIALQLGNTNNVTEAINAVKKEIQYKCIILNCDIVADLKPVYSDLAANGKILLHMSGTAGFIGAVNISDKTTDIINNLDSNRIQTEANQLLIQDLQALKERFFYREFLTSE